MHVKVFSDTLEQVYYITLSALTDGSSSCSPISILNQTRRNSLEYFFLVSKISLLKGHTCEKTEIEIEMRFMMSDVFKTLSNI